MWGLGVHLRLGLRGSFLIKYLKKIKIITMFLPFEKISPNARVWVYASDKPLNSIQKQEINTEIPNFLAQWTAHKQDLYASFEVFFDRFLIIAIDEQLQGASGCSIDASVRFVQELGAKLGVDFMCRDIFFIQNDNTLTQISPLKVKNVIQNQEINPKTLIFNPTISQKQDIDTIWQQPAEQSFLKRYFLALQPPKEE